MSVKTRALLTLLLLVSANGCRDVDETWHSTSEISRALLTVSDLGENWRETQRDIFDERDVENPVLDRSLFCPASSSTTTELESLAGDSGADVELRMKDSTRMIRLQAWNNDDAARFFAVVSAAVVECDGSKWSDETVGVETSLEMIDGPDIGDVSVHWSTFATPPADNPDQKFGGVGRTTVAVFDEVVMVLQVGDFALEPSSVAITDDEWRDLVELASKKIENL